MDRDEEEGLRAFAVTVGMTAGDGDHGRPQWIERAGERREVTEIEAEWREEERIGFRVRLADGASVLLYYVPELNLWSGVWPARGVDGMVHRRL